MNNEQRLITDRDLLRGLHKKVDRLTGLVFLAFSVIVALALDRFFGGQL